jgi:conjugal transfer pilus assembly protein TraF
MIRVLLLILIFPSLALGGTYFNRHQEGWFWYQDPPEELKKNPSVAVITAKPSASQELESLREQINEALNLAVMRPNAENISNYMALQQRVFNQAEVFKDHWQMALLRKPELDYSLKAPTNHNARIIASQLQQSRSVSAIHQLSQTHGFFFFFSSDCPYCHSFAPTVKHFAERYGISVMAISMDGKPINEFPNAIADNGSAKSLGVSAWPALFAINPKTREVVPLANGMVSLSDLEERVLQYLDFKKHAANHGQQPSLKNINTRGVADVF